MSLLQTSMHQQSRFAATDADHSCCCVKVCGLLDKAAQGLGPQQSVQASKAVLGNANQHRQVQTPEQRQASLRARLVKKFSAKSAVYENCKMFSQDGELLCFCDLRKLTWYEVSTNMQGCSHIFSRSHAWPHLYFVGRGGGRSWGFGWAGGTD